MKLFVTIVVIVAISVKSNAQDIREQLQRIVSYTSCSYDDDCKEHSFCFGNDGTGQLGKCKCRSEFIMNRNVTYYECLETLENIESPCLRDVQCKFAFGAQSVCLRKTERCQCNPGHHFGPDYKCYKSVNLTDFCEVDKNCLLSNGEYGFCVDGKCSCNLLHHPSEDKQRCVKTGDLGGVCTGDDSCRFEFAKCYGVCKCMGGYVETKDNTQCLKAADEFGDPCIERLQCSGYLTDSTCYNGTCVCNGGYHGYGNDCVLTAKVGEPCTEARECIWRKELKDAVDCVKKLCTCLEGVSDDEVGCKSRNGYSLILPSKNWMTTLIVLILFFGCA